MDRRLFLSSCVTLAAAACTSPAAFGSALKPRKVPSERTKAFLAMETLANGGTAPIADVQTLIVHFTPDVISPVDGVVIRLIRRGGKKRLLNLEYNGPINLYGLYYVNVLTPEGVKAIRDKRCDIYFRSLTESAT